jgi:sugar lactone lactonase YvrE
MNVEEPLPKRFRKAEKEEVSVRIDATKLRILFREFDFPLTLRLISKEWNKIFMETFALSENRLREMCSASPSLEASPSKGGRTEHEGNRARKVMLWLVELSQKHNRQLSSMFISKEAGRLLIRTRYELSDIPPRRLFTFSYSPYDIEITGNTFYVCDYTSHLRSYSLDTDFHLIQTFAFDHAPFSIASDSTTGNILVCFRDRHSIKIYQPTGALIREIGGYGEERNQLRFPRGIAAKNGLIYIADADNARVSVFSISGAFFQHIGLNQLTSPHSIALDDQGHRLLVTDGSHKVFIFSITDGRLLNTFGERGLVPGSFNYPRGITVDLFGNILICDCDNSRIQVFDSNGEFLHTFGHRDDHSGNLGWFSYPSFISVDNCGNVFVSEWSKNRVQMF